MKILKRILILIFALGGWAVGAIFILFWVLFPPKNIVEENRKNDCFIGESTRFIDSQYVNGKFYELVTKTTGFSDKITFIELYELDKYANDVTFDACGTTKSKLIDSIDIYYGSEHEPTAQWPVSLKISSEKILIEYGSNKDEALPIINLPIVWEKI